jgi:hypothetical protein
VAVLAWPHTRRDSRCGTGGPGGRGHTHAPFDRIWPGLFVAGTSPTATRSRESHRGRHAPGGGRARVGKALVRPYLPGGAPPPSGPAPVVQRPGRQAFNLETRVRFPSGVWGSPHGRPPRSEIAQWQSGGLLSRWFPVRVRVSECPTPACRRPCTGGRAAQCAGLQIPWASRPSSVQIRSGALQEVAQVAEHRIVAPATAVRPRAS